MNYTESILEHIHNALPNAIEIFIFGVIFMVLERLRPAEQLRGLFKDDMKAETLLAVTNILIFAPLVAGVALLFVNMTVRPLLPEQFFDDTIQGLPLMVQIILGAVVLDFSTYWRHRFTHFHMWSYHAIHHSAKQINWITSLRLHPVDLLAGAMFDSIILYLVGFTGAGFLGAMIVIRGMNYFTHMNLHLKFDKPLRYIIASPHYHRWHHANQKDAYDKNFCGAFPFLDLLFGTYYHPEELPEHYGLSKGDDSFFPHMSFVGWLSYPFKRDIKNWRKRKSQRR